MKYPRFRFFISLKTDAKQFFKLFFKSFKNTKLKKPAQNMLESFFGRPVSFHSSYRVGLYKTLRSLALKEGSEVIIGPINIPDAINIILILKLKPVFADLNRDTQCLDSKSVIEKINSNTRVVILTYLSGLTANYDELISFCNERNIVLIEDISQNYGARASNGKLIGTQTRFAIGSTCVGKAVCTTYGGILICSEKDQEKIAQLPIVKFENLFLIRLIYLYKHFYFLLMNIFSSKYIFQYFTFNLLRISQIREAMANDPPPIPGLLEKIDIFNDEYRPLLRARLPDEFFFDLSDWQYQYLIDTFEHFQTNNAKRQALAKDLVGFLNDAALEALPKSCLDFSNSIFYHFPIYCFADKNAMIRYMFDRDIDCAGYGLNLCNEEAIFEKYFSNCPVAQNIKYGCVFIPLHEGFSTSDMKYIASALNDYYQQVKNRNQSDAAKQI